MHTTTQESDIRIVKQNQEPKQTQVNTNNKMSASTAMAIAPNQKLQANNNNNNNQTSNQIAAVVATTTTPTNSPAKGGPGGPNAFNNNKANVSATTPATNANTTSNNSNQANNNIKSENKTPAQQPNKNTNIINNNNNNNNSANKNGPNNINKTPQNNNNNNNANKGNINNNNNNNNNKNNVNHNLANKNNVTGGAGANPNNQQKNTQNPNNNNNNNKGNFNTVKNENKPGVVNNQNNNNNKFQNGHHGANDKNKEQHSKQIQNNPNGSNNANSNNNNNNQAQTSYGEKKFTGRCRLFVGNLPSDITEKEFSELFTKYGDVGECFLNTQRSFGFVKLDTRLNAEHAKQELDGHTLKGRCIRVRFASHGAAVKVKNLSPYISNEYLEQAFSMFGPVERAVVIVDDKGRPTGDGIVEFERKPAATQCINKCTESFFILTGYPKPVIVEPLDQKDDEDGLPEKSIIKNNQFYTERETGPHFAPNGSYEQKLAMRWRELYELEKQIQEDGRKRIEQAREMLEYEVDQALIDQRTLKLKEDLRMKQEELQRMEEMRKTELQRRQDMEFRRIEEERRRQEEMMMFSKPQEGMRGGAGPMNGNNMSILNTNGPQKFDPMINQPHQQAGGVVGGNNRNRGPPGNATGGGFNQPGGDFGGLNQMGTQQQAMLAAFAMAAAAQSNLAMPNNMFDQGMNNNMNNGKGPRGVGGGEDNRNGNGRAQRQFDRRGGRGGGNGMGSRDDPSPFPGYDSKRARF